MTFYLYRNKAGRVVLDSALPQDSVLMNTIDADNWIAARSTIKEFTFEYREGHGYF